MVNRDMFGFYDLFGFVCSGLCYVQVVLQCSVCSVDFVENLCKNMWVSLWVTGGKESRNLWNSEFYTKLLAVLHGWQQWVESFTASFAQRIFSVSRWFCTFSTESTIITTNILGERI